MKKNSTKVQARKARIQAKLEWALSQNAPSPRGRKLGSSLRDAWFEWRVARKDRKPAYRILAIRYWVFPPRLREELLRMKLDEVLLAKQILMARGKAHPTVELRRLTELMKKGIQRLERQADKRFGVNPRHTQR